MEQVYTPIAESLAWSTVAAALPILVLLLMIGVLRKPAWISALTGLAVGLVVAVGVYGMPATTAVSSTTMGAAFGWFPIGWIVFWAVVLYRLTVETGQFEIIKDSIGGLTTDRRLQAMLIAFALGAFIEGAAGFGTPVAVAAAMLTGLGFSPFFAAGICLLANTAPVAFGSIGIPVTTLATVTGLDELTLSTWVGRLCAPVSVFIPAYLVMVMGGFKALKGVLPAAIVCGVSFAGMQLFMSAAVGPQLVDIVAALTAITALVILFKVWQPSDEFHMEGEHAATIEIKRHAAGPVLLAWSPYLLLVVFVLLWGSGLLNNNLFLWTQADLGLMDVPWPGLHEVMIRGPEVTAGASAPYTAEYDINWLSAAGSACALATFFGWVLLRFTVAPEFTIGKYVALLGSVLKQLAFSLITIGAIVGLAFLMNYAGATVTLGLAFAETGRVFPFFSAILGWLGVFLTGSDTSANALFGNLQVVTANQLGLDPNVMASANSAGGVMGKMISLQSLAVAVAATGMARSQEGDLFRFTFKHSIFLASVLGGLTMIYAAFT